MSGRPSSRSPGEQYRRVAPGEPERAHEPDLLRQNPTGKLERLGLLTDLQAARPGVCDPSRHRQTEPSPSLLERAQDRCVEPAQPCPGDPVAESGPRGVARSPRGEVRGDGRIGMQEQSVAYGRERKAKLVSHG